MRLCLGRIVPPRREAPVALRLPTIENRGDIRAAMAAVAGAAATGAITSAQSDTPVRMLRTVLGAI